MKMDYGVSEGLYVVDTDIHVSTLPRGFREYQIWIQKDSQSIGICEYETLIIPCQYVGRWLK